MSELPFKPRNVYRVEYPVPTPGPVSHEYARLVLAQSLAQVAAEFPRAAKIERAYIAYDLDQPTERPE